MTRILYAVREKKGCAVLSGVYGCGKTLVAPCHPGRPEETGKSRFQWRVCQQPRHGIPSRC